MTLERISETEIQMLNDDYGCILNNAGGVELIDGVTIQLGSKKITIPSSRKNI